jgi:hypothetical protein
MSSRTIYLSRLLGLYCLILGAAMALRREVIILIFQSIVENATWLFFAGIIALAAGLAMVLAHNIWRGGVLPIVVTLIGWLSLLKGVLLLFLTPAFAAIGILVGPLYSTPLFYADIVVCLLLGAYLTIAGFKSRSS